MNKLKDLIESVAFQTYKYFYYRKQKFQRKICVDRVVSSLKFKPLGLKILGNITVIEGKSLVLGNNVHFGHQTFLDARGGISISDHCHFDDNIAIYSTNYNHDGKYIPFDNNLIPGRVIIKRGVIVGSNVCIMPNVTIGEGAVVRPGTTVTNSIKPGEIIASENAKQIGERDLHSFQHKFEKGSFSDFLGQKISKAQIFKKNLTLLQKKEIGESEQLVFVLSTGRSGSNAIANFLNNWNQVTAFHEPFYTFLKVLSSNYLAGKISKNETKRELLHLYSSACVAKKGKIYVESDQKLVPLLPFIIEIFPNAKYIWLIREPSSFLKSAKARGWFKDDKPIFNDTGLILQPEYFSDGARLYKEQLIETEKENFSQEEEILFYWEYWNKLIETKLRPISKSCKFILKLENLENDKNALKKFLSLDSKEQFEVKKTNKVRSKHRSKYVEPQIKDPNHLEDLNLYYGEIDKE
jgi:acetyltransferase-like isoleucine patch superfamily enzyme